MKPSTVTVQLDRIHVENIDAELFVAMGPNVWDPVSQTMTWYMESSYLTWLLLQWPELRQLMNKE